MSNGIWQYHEARIDTDQILFRTMECMFCKAPLVRDLEEENSLNVLKGGLNDTEVDYYIGICRICGWWKHACTINTRAWWTQSTELKYGILRSLDLSNIEVPLKEIRQYLTVKYDQRFNVHPRVFEELVADIFKDLGYSVMVTAYSGDGGIDIILRKGDKEIGVQVKRYKNSISVEQIRSLTGALVIKNQTHGIFVTTSDFQSGADDTAKLSGMRGYPIELVNASKFYEILKLSQINSYKDADSKPWKRV